jgi:hypothetical protein
VVDACTSATRVGEAASDTIIQDAPTDWIRPPKFDARLDIHTMRKIGMVSGEGVAGGGEGAGESEVSRAISASCTYRRPITKVAGRAFAGMGLDGSVYLLIVPDDN